MCVNTCRSRHARAHTLLCALMRVCSFIYMYIRMHLRTQKGGSERCRPRAPKLSPVPHTQTLQNRPAAVQGFKGFRMGFRAVWPLNLQPGFGFGIRIWADKALALICAERRRLWRRSQLGHRSFGCRVSVRFFDVQHRTCFVGCGCIHSAASLINILSITNACICATTAS